MRCSHTLRPGGGLVPWALITGYGTPVFWLGFALPIPWVFGAARLALLVADWRRLVLSAKKEISHA